MSADLRCQKCPAVYMFRFDRNITEAAARFAGWKVYSGPTMGYGWTDVVLCPDCGGSLKRVRVNRNEPIDGQEPFDLAF